MALVVKEHPPTQSIIPPLVSDSVHILSTKHVEVLPESQVQYSYSTNNQIIFNINSSSEFIDFLDSYFRIKVNVTATDGGADIVSKCLNQGGALSLFRNIEIRTSSGTVLERIDRSNILYNILSNGSHSREHVDSMLAMTGDSYGCGQKEVECGGELLPFRVSITAPLVNTVNRSGGDVTPSDYVTEGDIVEYRSSTGVLLQRNRVRTVSVGVVVDDGPLWSNDFATAVTVGGDGADGAYVYKVSKKCTRSAVANEEAVLTFKPFHSGFMMMRTWFPLFLMKSAIQVVFTLERPKLCISNAIGVTGAYVADVTIDQPRLFAKMIKPSMALTQSYVDKYQSKEGIAYHFLSHRHILNTYNGGAGTYNEPLHVNARSTRHVYVCIRPNEFENDNATLTNMDKLSDFHWAGVSKYQFVSGSDRFPIREVECDNRFMYEALQQYVLTLNKYGSTLFDLRFEPQHWWRDNWVPSTDYQESKKVVYSTRTDRSDAPFSGYDSSVVPINVEMTFSQQFTDAAGANQNRVIIAFAAYDTILSLQKDAGIRIMN